MLIIVWRFCSISKFKHAQHFFDNAHLHHHLHLFQHPHLFFTPGFHLLSDVIAGQYISIRIWFCRKFKPAPHIFHNYVMHIYTLTVHCCLYWYIFYTWHSSFVRCYCWAILNLIIIIPTDYYMEPCPFVVSSVIRMYPVYPCIMYPAGFVVCMRNYYLKLTYSQKQLKFRLKSFPSDGTRME